MMKQPNKPEMVCGACLFYEPDQDELGSGNCAEIQRREEPDEKNSGISVLADESECLGEYWTKGKDIIIVCPVCKEGFIKLSDTVALVAKQASWQNFFDVLFDLKNPIERTGDKSISNFWAFLQSLQQQYNTSPRRNDEY